MRVFFDANFDGGDGDYDNDGYDIFHCKLWWRLSFANLGMPPQTKSALYVAIFWRTVKKVQQNVKFTLNFRQFNPQFWKFLPSKVFFLYHFFGCAKAFRIIQKLQHKFWTMFKSLFFKSNYNRGDGDYASFQILMWPNCIFKSVPGLQIF